MMGGHIARTGIKQGKRDKCDGCRGHGIKEIADGGKLHHPAGHQGADNTSCSVGEAE